jgi:hypothetical protein
MRRALIGLAAVIWAAGCEPPPPPPMLEVRVSGEAEVDGLVITDGRRAVGTTGADGSLDLPAVPGGMHRVDVRCPIGFVSHGVSVRVPEHEPPSRLPVSLRCEVDRVTAVVVVRVDGGPGLSILVDDVEGGVTDDDGIAFLRVRRPPDHVFEVVVQETETKKVPEGDGRREFRIGRDDALFVLDTRVRRPTVRRKSAILARPQPTGPYRLR